MASSSAGYVPDLKDCCQDVRTLHQVGKGRWFRRPVGALQKVHVQILMDNAMALPTHPASGSINSFRNTSSGGTKSLFSLIIFGD
jgi:hypothetical protein